MPRMSITLRPAEVQRALRYQQPVRRQTARKLCKSNTLVFISKRHLFSLLQSTRRQSMSSSFDHQQCQLLNSSRILNVFVNHKAFLPFHCPSPIVLPAQLRTETSRVHMRAIQLSIYSDWKRSVSSNATTIHQDLVCARFTMVRSKYKN